MIEERISSVIAKELEVKPEEVTSEARFIEDLGADSLDLINVTLCLEDEFCITIPDDDAEKIETVGQCVEYIKNRLTKEA